MHPSLFNVTSPFHYPGMIRVQKNIIKSSCEGGGVCVCEPYLASGL